MPDLVVVSVQISVEERWMGSLTPIRAKHIHHAGKTVETRSPTAAGRHARAATSSDVREINLVYRTAPGPRPPPVARRPSDHESQVVSSYSHRSKTITMPSQLALPRGLNENGL